MSEQFGNALQTFNVHVVVSENIIGIAARTMYHIGKLSCRDVFLVKYTLNFPSYVNVVCHKIKKNRENFLSALEVLDVPYQLNKEARGFPTSVPLLIS